MTHEKFEELLERRLSLTRQVLASKAKEYAQDSNRLHNFYAAAQLICGTPEQALWGMLAKHLVSIRDLILTHSEVKQEIVDEKIGDAINYLILLEAIWND